MTFRVLDVPNVAVSGELSDIVRELARDVKAYPILFSQEGVTAAALHPGLQYGRLSIGDQAPVDMIYITGGPIRNGFPNVPQNYTLLNNPQASPETCNLSF